MKIPYSWLTEWTAIPWDARELGSRLTMSGFEVEALEPAAPPFTAVVVGEILAADRHPQADKLQVCKVSIGRGAPLQIVCGASNARRGLKSALAMVGAQLPGEVTIGAAKLRGMESQGMLASARELGLADTSSGILELPDDAPVGAALREYLNLDEMVLHLNITPNRGDAMSVLGVAREVVALSGGSLTAPSIARVPTQGSGSFPVRLADAAGCPRFAGCIVRGIDNAAATPLWMRERLRRAGLRSITPVVDITNYVMLELGQPMHAYDLAKLKEAITVRRAEAGEGLTLLDGTRITAASDVLVIADAQGPVGLAGIMGGERTAVSAATTDVFFESAYFAPAAVLGRARRFGLTTDASQRFERGVDPTQQARAIERAVALLTPITGGTAGPIEVTESANHLPRRPAVTLRTTQLQRLLGAA
ncbi:MAG: phenylalanine--tRNA ligase subunit beta, partial [Sinobacteraceae bacterium]|nr:phenylalanine--tRNA ligase subunit beta [Nevskiaceae bacterium]